MNIANLIVGWVVIIWMVLMAIRSATIGQIMIPGLIGILFILGVVMDQDIRSKVRVAERLERAKDDSTQGETST